MKSPTAKELLQQSKSEFTVYSLRIEKPLLDFIEKEAKKAGNKSKSLLIQRILEHWAESQGYTTKK